MKCPKCGKRLSDWKRHDMQPLGFSQDVPGGFSQWERSRPIAQMSVKSNVTAPIAAAVVTGILWGIVSIIPTAYFAWTWRVPVIVTVVATAIAWFAYFSLSAGLLRSTETVIGHEGDGDYGEAQEVRIEIAKTNHSGRIRGFEFLDLNVDADVLIGFAQDISSGGSLGVHRWAGRSRPFTRGDYDEMMNALERRGYIRRIGGSRGRELTAKGERVFEELARR